MVSPRMRTALQIGETLSALSILTDTPAEEIAKLPSVLAFSGVLGFSKLAFLLNNLCSKLAILQNYVGILLNAATIFK